jgi:hypothetical protein
MDGDPELDVTLSNGRHMLTFQIAAVADARETWAVLEPGALRREIRGHAAALVARQRVDLRIAARLEAGWVPVDARTAAVAPTPLPPDLGLQISSLLEALGQARSALGAADPSGRLWAACHLFIRQARRFGIGAPRARVVRAQRKRRLGKLAEEAGDIPAAILHYRAALAAHAGVGVKRRLLRLAPPRPAAAALAPTSRASSRRPRGLANPSPARRPPAHSTRLWAARERSCVSGHSARASRRSSMNGRIQIVGRLPVALNRRVRAAAKRRKVSLNAFLIEALTQALRSRRVAQPQEAR